MHDVENLLAPDLPLLVLLWWKGIRALLHPDIDPGIPAYADVHL